MQDEYEIPFGNSSCSKIFTYLNNSDNTQSIQHPKQNTNIPLENQMSCEYVQTQMVNQPEIYDNYQHQYQHQHQHQYQQIPLIPQDKYINTSSCYPEHIKNNSKQGCIPICKNINDNTYENVNVNQYEMEKIQSNNNFSNLNKNIQNSKNDINRNLNKNLNQNSTQNSTSISLKNNYHLDDNYQKYLEYMRNKEMKSVLEPLKNNFLDNDIYSLYGYNIKYKHLLYAVTTIILLFIIYKIWKWMKNNDEKNNNKENIKDENKIDDDDKKKKKKDKRDKKSQDDSLYIPIYNNKN